MKKSLILFVLVISCTFAQAQINLPKEEKASKFSVGLNTTYFNWHGLTAELNLGMELKKNRSLYLGMGGNRNFYKYARIGIMQNIIVRPKFTLGVGAGLNIANYDFSVLAQGKHNSINFEIPIEAKYRISDRFSVTASLRTGIPIYQQFSEYDFGLSQGFNTSLYLGVNYRFNQKKK